MAPAGRCVRALATHPWRVHPRSARAALTRARLAALSRAPGAVCILRQVEGTGDDLARAHALDERRQPALLVRREAGDERLGRVGELAHRDAHRGHVVALHLEPVDLAVGGGECLAETEAACLVEPAHRCFYGRPQLVLAGAELQAGMHGIEIGVEHRRTPCLAARHPVGVGTRDGERCGGCRGRRRGRGGRRRRVGQRADQRQEREERRAEKWIE